MFTHFYVHPAYPIRLWPPGTFALFANLCVVALRPCIVRKRSHPLNRRRDERDFVKIDSGGIDGGRKTRFKRKMMSMVASSPAHTRNSRSTNSVSWTLAAHMNGLPKPNPAGETKKIFLRAIAGLAPKAPLSR